MQLETFEVGKDRLVIVTIAPDPKKKECDLMIPVLSPILTRKKSLAEEVAAFKCPVFPRKADDKAAKQFRYEGYDLITLQKLVEREYTIPEPQTAEEVAATPGFESCMLFLNHHHENVGSPTWQLTYEIIDRRD